MTSLITSLVTSPVDTFLEDDKKYVWHPYTKLKEPHDPFVISEAKGAYLYTEDGRKLFDATSSWWVNLHGHTHPYIAEKVSEQAKKLEHVLFAGCTHAPAVTLAKRLVSYLPWTSRLFYSDNGSTAVEVAVKLALHYFQNLDYRTNRRRILAFEGGYHGDTFGAMSLAQKGSFNLPFQDYLFDVETLPLPSSENEEEFFSLLEERLAEKEGKKVACFVYEPLIQGASGMRLYSAEILEKLLARCRQDGVLLIADEVMTGFGRTDELFVSQALPTKPDLLCLSKGITGGFLPLGATLVAEKICGAFYRQEESFTFLHGHSYTANPLACASALASFDLLLLEETFLQREMLASLHRAFVERYKKHPKLKRLDSLGTILACEFQAKQQGGYFDPLSRQIAHYFHAQNILVRPLGNTLYLMPPYCTTEEELLAIYRHITHFLEVL
jgi:adenosylmethionine---8-amino-7-oxononanoate aminotransferase